MNYLLDIEFATNPATIAQHNFEILDNIVGLVGESSVNILINGAEDPATMEGGVAWLIGVAPTADVADQISMWVGDRVAGEAGLRLRSESGVLHHLGDRVGIGTLDPESLLHVAGDIQLDENLRLGTDDAVADLSNGIIMATGVAATGTVPAGLVAIWFDGTQLWTRIGTTDAPIGGGGSVTMFVNAGDPNGVVEAEGPAMCMDTTNLITWHKYTSGTSNNEWV